jgi:hypothetical protein
MYVPKKQLIAASENYYLKENICCKGYMRSSSAPGKQNDTAGRSRIDEKSAGSFLGQKRTSLTEKNVSGSK